MFGGGGGQQARYAAVPQVELQRVPPGSSADAAAEEDVEDAALEEENRHMPLTALRHATWHSAAFHSVSAAAQASCMQCSSQIIRPDACLPAWHACRSQPWSGQVRRQAAASDSSSRGAACAHVHVLLTVLQWNQAKL